MPNGSFDPVAQYARLNERVDNQAKDLVDLRSNMNTGFANVQHSISTLSAELRGNSRTQWPVIWSAIGVSFAIIVAIGGLAYAPVTSGIVRLEASLAALGERTISRQEMDWRQARGQEDRIRMEGSISDVRSGLVPRAEHERVWQNYDQRLQDHQRQLDEMKQASANIYGQRDALLDMRERLDRLERERQRMMGTP